MTIEHITRANANVFEDLGLPDAENLKLRAQLMMEIRNFVNESGMTQTKAAMALKTTQPRLNEVLNGRMDKCTIDRLVQMLAEVGMHVNITITTDQAA
ncbi:MAG: helix-turn-helix domain-containing protein [Candidatus Thiodiazotropha sp. (ex Lucinoma kastoroae)]|nr:helix-turn-helix domain-containing protein [Candidatus Thiodiazotropha sp. (ex Lucinoma kastoroae)]